MKVLLVKPRYFEPKNQTVWTSVHPPLGLAYLAAVARENGYRVKIFDMEALKATKSDLKKLLLKERPDVVGINMCTPIFNNTAMCAKVVRETLPEAIIVIGGPHTVTSPKEILKKIPEVDFVMRGECEFTFLQLLSLIQKKEKKEKFKKIPGIAFRKSKELFVSEDIPRIENLDILPMPAYDILPILGYFDPLSPKKRLVMFTTTRGCPYNCIFCAEPVVYGHKVRVMSPKRVVEVINYFVKKLGVEYIRIDDSTFNFNIKRVEEICDLIIKRKIKVKWRVKARVDLITERMLVKMRRAGCDLISFGVESSSQFTINFLNKNYTLQQIERAFKLAKKFGIKTLAFFMIGFPHEKRKDIYNTIQYAKKLDPDFVEFTLPVPLPGTKFWEMVKDKLITNDWENFYQWKCTFKHPCLTSEELLRWYKRAYKSFYLRPRYILKRLKSIRSFGEFLANSKFFLFYLYHIFK